MIGRIEQIYLLNSLQIIKSSELRYKFLLMEPLETKISIGDYRLLCQLSKERLKLKYTNDQYEDFDVAIQQKTYPDQLPKIAIHFEEWSQFKGAFQREQVAFKLISEGKLELSIETSAGTKTKTVKQHLTMTKKEQTLEQKLRKEIAILKTENEAKQKKIDSFEEDLDKNNKEWKQKLYQIENKNRKNIPIRKSVLLEKESEIDQISDWALPGQSKKSLKNFIKRLQMQPKYLISVFGISNAGKSTLMNKLKENMEQMKQLYQKNIKNHEKIEIFPTNKNSYTYYDTFYCFNQQSKEIEVAKEVDPEDFFHCEKFKEECSEMTLFIDEKVNFESKSDLDLGKEHQNGRENFNNQKDYALKEKLFQCRSLIIRYNKDIFASKDEKYSYLNKYIVLVDRTGINDMIYTQLKDKIGKQDKQMKKLRNDTVLYCMHGLDLSTSDTNNQQNMLALMKTHEFEKIIMCVNQHNSLQDSGLMHQKDRLGRIDTFFEQIFECVPKHICYLLGQHVKNLQLQSESIRNKLKSKLSQKTKEEVNHEEEQELNQQDKTLRLQINRYKDQLQKFNIINQEFKKFSKDIRKKIKEEGIDEHLEKEILTKIKKYPFSNVHIFGLENYAEKFPIIDQIKKYSNSQLYKTIGVQSLNSIQKYYYYKSQKLNQYQNQLEQHYTSLQIFLQELRYLDSKVEDTDFEKIKDCFSQFLKSLREFVEQIEKKVALFIVQIQSKRQNQIGKELWELLTTHTQNISKKLHIFNKKFFEYREKLLFKISKRKATISNWKPFHTNYKTAWQNVIEKNLKSLFTHVEEKVEFQIRKCIKMFHHFIDNIHQSFQQLFPSNSVKDLKIPRLSLEMFKASEKKFLGEQNIKNFFNVKDTSRKRIFQFKDKFEKFLTFCKQQKKESLSEQNPIQKNIPFIQYLHKKQEKDNKLQKEKKEIQDAITALQQKYSQHLQNINFDMILHGVKKEDLDPVNVQ